MDVEKFNHLNQNIKNVSIEMKLVYLALGVIIILLVIIIFKSNLKQGSTENPTNKTAAIATPRSEPEPQPEVSPVYPQWIEEFMNRI